ncbi:thioredoxin family protein [Alphaproteobacteria bacterium endosymbiont of Tiliacea citrago]|uniref:thioredoxin family protein n=1 Tax=Alphaproteobacteria bacterium endosymbiont of Tiliacea citrago TaxID=3077944 RepID=UPI00313E2E03
MSLIIKSENDFHKFVLEEKDIFVVVYFFAQWCGPCKMFSSVFESVCEEYQTMSEDQKVKIYKIDIDNLSKISADYGILSIPTFIIFRNGVECARQIGIQEDFSDWVASNIINL